MQSIAFSVEMKDFLCKLQNDPDSSALAALLCQREALAAHLSCDAPAVEENTALLGSFEVRTAMFATEHILDYCYVLL